jgi:hypothetical protein
MQKLPIPIPIDYLEIWYGIMKTGFAAFDDSKGWE